MNLLHWRQSRTLSGGGIPLQTIYDGGCQDFVIERFRSAARAGPGRSARDSGIYLGDVTGKGLPAALYSALAVGTLRGVHKTGTPPATVLSTVNRRVMLRGVSARYAAAQYACFDPRTGILRIASAGMTVR